MLNRKQRRIKNRAIEAVRKIRIHNLQLLIEHYNGQAQLARELGVTESYLTQLCGPNPSREIGEEAARNIEQTLGIRSGWLDLIR